MELIIRPKNRELAEVEVVNAGSAKRQTIRMNISTSLLRAVDKILDGQKPEKILVDISNASFSSKRLGLAIGKTLEFAWGVELRIIG